MGDGGLRVVLFTSRNKDNRHLNGFKKRSKSFLANQRESYLDVEFERFVSGGVSGEISRMYVSVNTRDPNKIRKDFIHYLVDHEDFDMRNCSSKIASIASRKKNGLDSKWLFDFDCVDISVLNDFLADVGEYIESGKVSVHPTINGYAVVTDHGFDTRELLSKWSDVDLKRDGLLLYKYAKN